ncbi:transposase [Pandoraea captiosa]|uniref:Transposase n=1 Tax=Pandoraea captiosa TaxID=2508302 RepID=A0A5E4ZX88_9BURK|nr:TniB family NTP-binding protein [Pandoraea captiosa]VVE64560.1 transposase [Pandoraea captiosa]
MSNNYSHVRPEFQHVLALSDAERLAYLDMPRWIGYTAAQRLLDNLQSLLAKPQRPRMPSLLIVGDSNNGKTTIVRRFLETCGKGYVTEEMEAVKPVILAEAPPSADEKGLYISILEQFFATYRASDPTAKLRYQVIHMFRTCHVRMLVIDEFHSMLTGSAIKQREVMNAIKLLCNELAIPIVGVGTREAVRVLHTDPQHASRFDVFPLPIWSLDKEFQRLLLSFERTLPLKEASNLSEPERATLLHTICNGNLGNLHRLLVECSQEAIKSGTERIDDKIIKSKAWMRPTQGVRHISV